MNEKGVVCLLAQALSGDTGLSELEAIQPHAVPSEYRVAFDAIMEDAQEHGTVDAERILSNANGVNGALRGTFFEILTTATTLMGNVEPIYTSGDLPTATAAAWGAIERANTPPTMFRYGGVPVRISEDDAGRPTFEVLTLDRMGHVVARVAPWKERHFDKKTQQWVEREVPPPIRVIKDLLATPANEMPLPIVTGIAEVPTFSSGGILCAKPGYNPENRTYYVPPAGLIIPPIPEKPTEEDVRLARELLLEPLLEIPFAGDADRAHTLALAILPYTRDIIGPYTPIHLFDAPIHGSGKTLSARAALTPALGDIMFVSQATDDEYRKRITAQAIAGRSLFFLDNLTVPLSSAVISLAVTGAMWTDRVLGKSVEISTPNKMIWVVTGNNVVLSGELTRRSVRIRIDPNTDQPWLRDGFKYPHLEAWIADNRGALVGAALTIIRAWVNDGMKPWSGAALGSVVTWSRVIGGILTHAGIGGFLTNLDELYEEADIENVVWREFVTAWWEAHQDGRVGTAELFPIAEKIEGIDLGKSGPGTEKAQRTSLGAQLRKHKDNVYGEYKITKAGKTRRASVYRLLPVKKRDPQPAVTPTPIAPTLEPPQKELYPGLTKGPDGNWYLQ